VYCTARADIFLRLKTVSYTIIDKTPRRTARQIVRTLLLGEQLRDQQVAGMVRIVTRPYAFQIALHTDQRVLDERRERRVCATGKTSAVPAF